ncbi:hypothetical protein DRQ33_00295 [bacterium]|nr:MAG: hypothetical protein DRQ33_00295 [bacterium]
MRTIAKIVILSALLACAFGEPQYSAYWARNDYPNDLITVMGDMRGAEQIAEKLRQSESPEALFELGRLYYSRGLYRQALAFFQRTDFGEDVRLLLMSFCYIILDQKDSAKVYLSQINQNRLRAWSSAGLARMEQNIPSAVADYPYLANFFAEVKPNADSTFTGGFTIQFGAFSDSSRAFIMMNKLKDIGLEPYIQKTVVNEQVLYRVRAERFRTKQEAEEAASALGDQFIYMIVPVE